MDTADGDSNHNCSKSNAMVNTKIKDCTLDLEHLMTLLNISSILNLVAYCTYTIIILYIAGVRLDGSVEQLVNLLMSH